MRKKKSVRDGPLPSGNQDRERRSALLTRVQAAEYLGMSEQTLRCWAVDGRGPVFIKLGTRSVRYRVEDIDRWLDEGKRNEPVSLL